MHNLAPLNLAHDTLPQALRNTVVQWAERHHTRAERNCGTLTVESEPGHGTAISTRLPGRQKEQGESGCPTEGGANPA